MGEGILFSPLAPCGDRIGLPRSDLGCDVPADHARGLVACESRTDALPRRLRRLLGAPPYLLQRATVDVHRALRRLHNPGGGDLLACTAQMAARQRAPGAALDQPQRLNLIFAVLSGVKNQTQLEFCRRLSAAPGSRLAWSPAMPSGCHLKKFSIRSFHRAGHRM